MKPCKYPGCFVPTDDRSGYCSKHKEAGLSREKLYKEQRRAKRKRFAGSSSSRGYGYRWQKLRARYIAMHPVCVRCQKKGIFTMATDVDHIIPHKGDHKLLYDESNLQSLCHSCHQ